MSTHKSYTPPVPIEFYSVGDIYITTKSGNPYTWLQYGEWTQIKDRFLLAAGSTYSTGATGGEASHALTIAEMPAHMHVTSSYSTTTYGTGTTTRRYPVSASDSGKAATWYTDDTGGSQSHNNMPPSLAVNVWQRTA